MIRFLFSFVCLLAFTQGALAQDTAVAETNGASKVFEVNADAVNAVTLVAGRQKIKLWGIERIEGLSPVLKVRARIVLRSGIGSDKVECEAKARSGDFIVAQCVNSLGEDLSLLMLQKGLAVSDRATIAGSVFQQPYAQAEVNAQQKKVGVWSVEETGSDGFAGSDGVFYATAILVIFVTLLVAFGVLCVVIMRGFRKVVEAQNKNMDMIARERKMRNKERNVIAIMLDAEIKANKSKIEAYLIVYEEMLTALQDPKRQPKYKRAGDIVQRQPALDRSVFDKNTDKLDVLGGRVSSQVVHFYARIKTRPDYMNLEPETPLEDAIALVQGCVQKAQSLNKISESLIAAFEEGGMASDDFVLDD